jgi:hypothetical protein
MTRIDTEARLSLQTHSRDRSMNWRDIRRETQAYRRLTQINLTAPATALRRGDAKSAQRSSIISDAEQAKLRMLSSVTTSSPRQRALLRILITEHCFVHLLRTLFVVFVEPLTNAATGAADLPEGARGRGAAQLQSATASIMGSTAQKNLQGRIAKEVQNADVKLLLNGVEQIITINTKLLEDLGECFRPKGSSSLVLCLLPLFFVCLLIRFFWSASLILLCAPPVLSPESRRRRGRRSERRQWEHRSARRPLRGHNFCALCAAHGHLLRLRASRDERTAGAPV